MSTVQSCSADKQTRSQAPACPATRAVAPQGRTKAAAAAATERAGAIAIMCAHVQLLDNHQVFILLFYKTVV